MLSQVIEDGQIVDSYFTADPLTLDTKNADALILGSSTTEGGDIKVYRDASGNLQMSLDADAASNAKALDIYGGIVCQNYLTVGQTAIDINNHLFVAGEGQVTVRIKSPEFYAYTEGNGLKGITNMQSLTINTSVSTPDALDHAIKLQIDTNDIIVVQATGDGTGGITDKAIGLYGTTPATQAAAIADATDAASAITQLNLLLAANRGIGLIAT